MEPILPKKTIIVVGAGHVGLAVAKLAKWLGYFVIVNDDRPDFAVPALVPDADVHHTGTIKDLISNYPVHPQSNFVLTTRGVDHDIAGLPVILDTEAAYIGVIGSKRRWDTTRKKLSESGLDDEEITRIHSPMGLELGAETPEEIAVSILAEIIMISKGGDGSVMKSG